MMAIINRYTLKRHDGFFYKIEINVLQTEYNDQVAPSLPHQPTIQPSGKSAIIFSQIQTTTKECFEALMLTMR